MNTENQGLNNVLMVSLIISFILHISILNTDVDTINIDEEVILPYAEKEIQIPIEFIPTGQIVATRQYSIGEIEATKKLVSETNDLKEPPLPQINRPGIYSLNKTKTILNQYFLAIREVIEKNKFSLPLSSYSNIVGNVKISFSISSEGEFSNIRIIESSGDQILDKSALSAIENASGKTKRPKNTGVKTIKASTIVKYQYGL
jgi:TonB family protein